MISLLLAFSAIQGAEVDAPQSAIFQVAVGLELADPREADYAPTLADLRERYARLIDAPPACDASRFPDRDAINDAIAFNRQYTHYMTDRQRLFGETPYLLAECERLYHVYDLARDTQCGFYYIHVRRQSLADLRDAIGWEAYYAGVLPAPIPVENLRIID